MAWRPRWRLPFKACPSYEARQSDAFKAARAANGGLAARPKCHHIRRNGSPCRMVALRGSSHCRIHGGHAAALIAEAERFGRPVIRMRRVRHRALAAYGATAPWPEGLPKHARFLNLGPMQRGRLFEAWENRLTAPDAWANELAMPRYRMQQKPKP